MQPFVFVGRDSDDPVRPTVTFRPAVEPFGAITSRMRRARSGRAQGVLRWGISEIELGVSRVLEIPLGGYSEA